MCIMPVINAVAVGLMTFWVLDGVTKYVAAVTAGTAILVLGVQLAFLIPIAGSHDGQAGLGPFILYAAGHMCLIPAAIYVAATRSSFVSRDRRISGATVAAGAMIMWIVLATVMAMSWASQVGEANLQSPTFSAETQRMQEDEEDRER